jgi:DNA-binding MarR family transcriptional regulator
MASPNPLFLREEELDRGLDLLYFAARRLDLDAAAARGQGGIDETDVRTLFLIDRQPGITLAELCAALGTSKQTLSRHLKRLAGSGLVDRQSAAQDRRKRPLRLTGRSGALLAGIRAAQKRRLRSAFKSAGATAVEGFQRVLLDLAGEPRREPLRRLAAGGRLP